MDTFTLILFVVFIGVLLTVAAFNLYLTWNLYGRKTPISTGFESQVLEKLERLHPAPPPKLPIPVEVQESIVSQAVTDAIFAAEQYAKQLRRSYPKEHVSNADKHAEAMKAAKQRLVTAGIELSDVELAKRIAITHATMKGTKRLG